MPLDLMEGVVRGSQKDRDHAAAGILEEDGLRWPAVVQAGRELLHVGFEAGSFGLLVHGLADDVLDDARDHGLHDLLAGHTGPMACSVHDLDNLWVGSHGSGPGVLGPPLWCAWTGFQLWLAGGTCHWQHIWLGLCIGWGIAALAALAQRSVGPPDWCDWTGFQVWLAGGRCHWQHIWLGLWLGLGWGIAALAALAQRSRGGLDWDPAQAPAEKAREAGGWKAPGHGYGSTGSTEALDLVRNRKA